MAGFGLDSLVVGSAEPKKKTFLKGAQTRAWTSFIEAVTADGRVLKPGVIFKGKDLQKQWFIDEFRRTADWYYITSLNGWTDNHIAVEWLKQVYLPQTKPADEGEARLILLDGHGSHAQDEWMAECFLNNVYCCYLPAHTSHGLQPLDNGVFNSLKACYRRELGKLVSLTDSRPVDKFNFIRCYARAREAAFTKQNIKSGWKVMGNWPISRRQAMNHPEIQEDRVAGPVDQPPERAPDDSPSTPKNSREIKDMGAGKSPTTRRLFGKAAHAFEGQQSQLAEKDATIALLQEELDRLKRGKKRKAVTNPNRRFITVSEALAAGEPILAIEEAEPAPGPARRGRVLVPVEESEESEDEEEEPPQIRTRSGRVVKRKQWD
ncbi:DDE superfamily endonuclease domain-containing protein [Apiospora phragmitis]|uniref:DDE superfamily endonuclease domain-containing protein n=1 Tax=Apiospora phragmitis TaxID=2905665 RepID=A0ABR1VT64_9PEZI